MDIRNEEFDERHFFEDWFLEQDVKDMVRKLSFLASVPIKLKYNKVVEELVYMSTTDVDYDDAAGFYIVKFTRTPSSEEVTAESTKITYKQALKYYDIVMSIKVKGQ